MHANTRMFQKGIGLPIVLIIIALALGGGGVSYYAVKQQAKKARDLQEKALREGEARLQEIRNERGEMMRHETYVIKLVEQNDSGQTGEVWIGDAGGKAKVTIKLEGMKSLVSQPAHIHGGACPSPGAVKYPLTSVVEGNSVTQLSVPVEDILNGLPLAINVHTSAEDLKTYVACGDISADAIMDTGEAMMNDRAKMESGEMTEGGGVMEGETGMTEEIKTFNIDARNFSFSKKEIRVKRGDRVRIDLSSVEGFHDWVVDEFNAKTSRVNTGQKTSVEFIADTAGTFEYYCSVGSHRQFGMAGKLIVE